MVTKLLFYIFKLSNLQINFITLSKHGIKLNINP